MRKNTLSFAVVAACLLASAPGFSQTATSSRTKTHVQTLASDKFEGRLTGSPGEKLAADYIIAELKRIGAQPLPGMTDFRMPFSFTAGSKDGGSKLTINRTGNGEVSPAGVPARAAMEFSGATNVQALSFSDTGEANGDVVFAGYGLVVPNSQ